MIEVPRILAFAPLLLGTAEIVVYVLVAGWIGLGWTVLLTLATSVAGVLLLRRTGLKAWRELRVATEAQVVDPAALERRLASGGTALMVSFLLVLPGFVTDAFGLALLIPAVRRGLGRRLVSGTIRAMPGIHRPGRPWPPQAGPRPRPGNRPEERPTVIEGEIVDDGPAEPDRGTPGTGR